jgi:hypothetical protein
MMWFYIAITALLVCILLVQVYWVWFVSKTQKQLLADQRESAPTMWDVREVLKEGDKDLAVQLFCQVFNIDDIERARREVEELARSMKA